MRRQTGLILACLCIAAAAWFRLNSSPALAQGTTNPILTVEGTGGLTEPGETVTYNIRLLSWADRPLPGGRITHTLPDGFSYVSNSTHVSVGGWPISTIDPTLDQNRLTWGPFRVPAAGHTAHNPYGVHTFVQDLCLPKFIDLQLDQALEMVGSGGYVTQLLNGAVTPTNTGFIRQMLAVPGFVNAFDVWASHCYPYNHPPTYNIHAGTARYGNATIDCYLVERDTIIRYGGRSDFKFVLTETGHGLGDNVYGFEGYPPINETNRASYMAATYGKYWRTWPELIAATPFELGDPWSGWEKFDWIDYTVNLSPLRFSFKPHLQYITVVSLDKPRGKTVPHSIEITFRARVTTDVSPGMYASNLSATADDATTIRNRTAWVQVASHVGRVYLPTISRHTQLLPPDGTWYQEESSPPTQEMADQSQTPGRALWIGPEGAWLYP